MQVIPNFLRNSKEIIRLAEKHKDSFRPREGDDTHASIIPNIYSKFKTLKDIHMSDELKTAIFADADFDESLEDFYEFIQIQRYDPGDYIAPHRDSYSIRKLHLITLTTSVVDSLICENEDHDFVRIPDIEGQYVDFPYDAVHYVSPVTATRYSLVVAE